MVMFNTKKKERSKHKNQEKYKQQYMSGISPIERKEGRIYANLRKVEYKQILLLPHKEVVRLSSYNAIIIIILTYLEPQKATT